MAKSTVKRKTKRPTKKKRPKVQQNQSLIPALFFLLITAGIITVLYFSLGSKQQRIDPARQKLTTIKHPPQPDKTPQSGNDLKTDRDKPADPVRLKPATLTIYRLSRNFNKTMNFNIPVDAHLSRQEKAQLIIRYLTLPGEQDQPPLPPATKLHSILFSGPQITIDLSAEITKGLVNSGTNDELLTLFCLTNSLLINFPKFKTLQILIDGNRCNTLAGHIDISHPLGYQSEI